MPACWRNTAPCYRKKPTITFPRSYPCLQEIRFRSGAIYTHLCSSIFKRSVQTISELQPADILKSGPNDSVTSKGKPTVAQQYALTFQRERYKRRDPTSCRSLVAKHLWKDLRATAHQSLPPSYRAFLCWCTLSSTFRDTY